MDISYIGSVIKELRDKHNLSQRRLARKLGISTKTVSAYETGKCQPSLDVMNALSELFGVNISSPRVKESSEKLIMLKLEELHLGLTEVERLTQNYLFEY